MKKITIITLSGLLAAASLISCKKETDNATPTVVEAVMEPVFFGFSNVNDSLSGKLLRPALDSIRLLYPNTVIINTHINHIGKTAIDSCSNSDSEGLAKFYNVYAHKDSSNNIPYSYFACDGFLGGYNWTGIKSKSFIDNILWAKDNKTPAMSLDIKPSLSGKNLTVKIDFTTKYEFTTATYLSVIVTEDNVKMKQVNDKGLEKNVHHDVFRHCITDYNGAKIANSLARNVTGNFTCSTTLADNWNVNNLKVNVIVWYYDSTRGNMIHLGKKVKI